MSGNMIPWHISMTTFMCAHFKNKVRLKLKLTQSVPIDI